MSLEAQKLCRRYGLKHVETVDLRLRRRRCGRGFTYVDGEGRTVRDKTLRERFNKLAIPPAWTEVCIAADERAHIQAVGRDAEHRLQYRYHPDWERARADSKALRLVRLGSVLPRVRGRVRQALSSPGLTRDKVIAAVVRLIDRALLRPGYEEYAQERGTRGASTLLKSDVVVDGDTVIVDFEGKGGKQVKQAVRDKLLARVTKRLAAVKGRRLFSVPDMNGRPKPITAREVNAYISATSGTDVTAKDFRTFRASAEALAYLTKTDSDESERRRMQAVAQAAEKASEILVNTRSVARTSYIHPSVIEAYVKGKLDASLFRGRIRTGLNKIESALMRFLERY